MSDVTPTVEEQAVIDQAFPDEAETPEVSETEEVVETTEDEETTETVETEETKETAETVDQSPEVPAEQSTQMTEEEHTKFIQDTYDIDLNSLVQKGFADIPQDDLTQEHLDQYNQTQRDFGTAPIKWLEKHYAPLKRAETIQLIYFVLSEQAQDVKLEATSSELFTQQPEAETMVSELTEKGMAQKDALEFAQKHFASKPSKAPKVTNAERRAAERRGSKKVTSGKGSDKGNSSDPIIHGGGDYNRSLDLAMEYLKSNPEEE